MDCAKNIAGPAAILPEVQRMTGTGMVGSTVHEDAKDMSGQGCFQIKAVSEEAVSSPCHGAFRNMIVTIPPHGCNTGVSNYGCI